MIGDGPEPLAGIEVHPWGLVLTRQTLMDVTYAHLARVPFADSPGLALDEESVCLTWRGVEYVWPSPPEWPDKYATNAEEQYTRFQEQLRENAELAAPMFDAIWKAYAAWAEGGERDV